MTEESPAGAVENDAGHDQRPGKKKKDHTGPIIVVVSIIGVIIAWVSYKHQSTGAGAGLTPTSGALGTGNVAGTGAASSSDQDALATLISNLGGLVTGLQTPVAGTTGAPIADNFPTYKRFLMHGSGDQNVYEIENGKAKLLTAAQWTELGRPKFDTVTTQDSDYALVQQSRLQSGTPPVSSLPPVTAPPAKSPVKPITV